MSGIGVDILELYRVRAIAHLERAAEYFLTAPEMQEFNERPDKIAYFASRFAAKEAVIKAFPERVSPLEFAIGKAGVKPIVTFLHPAYARYRTLVSISHSLEYATAFAVVYEPI